MESIEHEYDVTLSVVLYRDYETSLAMVQSLAVYAPAALKIHLYLVDNSGLKAGEPINESKGAFLRGLQPFGFVEYIDAGSNLGFGKAHNLALTRADSTYHIFVNPDVLFIEDAISALKEFMDRNPDVGMCVPRITDTEGKLQRVYWQQPTVLDAFNRMFLKNALKDRDRYYTCYDADYSQPFQVPFAQGSFLFGRTELLKSLGGFDEAFFMYLEDADLCRRVNNCSQLLYCPEASVVHGWERGSHKNVRLLGRHFKSYFHFFHKWGLRLA